jgi:hypothetical protein
LLPLDVGFVRWQFCDNASFQIRAANNAGWVCQHEGDRCEGET